MKKHAKNCACVMSGGKSFAYESHTRFTHCTGNTFSRRGMCWPGLPSTILIALRLARIPYRSSHAELRETHTSGTDLPGGSYSYSTAARTRGQFCVQSFGYDDWTVIPKKLRYFPAVSRYLTVQEWVWFHNFKLISNMTHFCPEM